MQPMHNLFSLAYSELRHWAKQPAKENLLLHVRNTFTGLFGKVWKFQWDFYYYFIKFGEN